jgi:hypothetical protein
MSHKQKGQNNSTNKNTIPAKEPETILGKERNKPLHCKQSNDKGDGTSYYKQKKIMSTRPNLYLQHCHRQKVQEHRVQ